MGFTEDIGGLDCLTAEALLTVDAEVETLKAEQLEKSMSKLKAKR